MKGTRILVFVLGGALALVALLAMLAFTPSVQTWAVRRAVAGQPGMAIEVERVAAGLTSFEISGLRVATGGVVVTAASATARYSAWAYLAQNRIDADDLTVRDLVVDLRANQGLPAQSGIAPGGVAGRGATAPGPSTGMETRPVTTHRPGTAEPPQFEGYLQAAQLPFELRLAAFAVNGRALLPAAQQVNFTLRGTDIGTGQRGQLEWQGDFADPKPDVPLQALRSTGTLALQLTDDGRLAQLELETLVSAEGPQLPSDRLRLNASAGQPTAGGDETYQMRLSLLRGNGAPEPLLGGNAHFRAATHEFSGTWDVALRSDQLGAMLAGLGLPELAVQGEGTFMLQPSLAASGRIEGTVADLAAVSPALAAVGAVRFNTNFDGGVAGDLARLDRLDLAITGSDGRKFAEINTHQKITYALTEKRVTLENPGAELARIALLAVPLAWAQPLAAPLRIESGDLSLLLAIEAEADGSRVRARALEPVSLRAVTLGDGETKLFDRASLSLRPLVDYSANRIVAELEELKFSTPAGDSLSGRLAANVTGPASAQVIAFTTQLQADIVDALKPYLPLDPGPLAVVIDAEGRYEGELLHLTKAAVVANRTGGGLLVAVDLPQSVRMDFKTASFTAADPAATAARIRLGEVPLEWAEAFVPQSAFAGRVAGGTLEVAFRSPDDLTINTTTPISWQGVGLTLDGEPMLAALDGLADFTATKRSATVGYEVRRIQLQQGEAPVATFSVAGEASLGAQTAFSAKGSFDVDAARLQQQPALKTPAALASGKVTAAFEVTIAETTQIKAVVATRGFVAREPRQTLGDLDFTLTGTLKPDGSGTVNLPLKLVHEGRTSDLLVEGTFGQPDETLLFTGKLTGEQVVVADFQPLAALMPASAETAPAPTPRTPPPERDEVPFWSGVNGKLQLDLKKVLYGKDYVIGGLRGTATIVDSRLALDALEGTFKENPFKASAAIAFNAREPKPYTLSGSADVADFDVGDFLRAASPGERPAIESKVTVSAKLNGSGATLDTLIAGIYGQFEATGTPGVLRALGRKGQTVGAVSSLIGIVGALRGSDTTMAVADLTAALNELRFDHFKMQLERSADLSIKVTALEILSPVMRATGTGNIASAGTGSILNQAMKFDLQFGAKDQLAALMNKAGVLGGQQDEQGYHLMAQKFSIGGTPANPDSSQLWRMIGEAAARAAAGALLR